MTTGTSKKMRRVLRRIGRRIRGAAIRRLSGTVGVRNQRLRPKKQPDGKPLGVKKGLGLFPLLRRAPIGDDPDGFDIVYDTLSSVFHRGRGPQVPREILGFSKRQEAEAAKAVGRQLAKEGSDLGVFV